ncbi:quinon protein alcohol dehydrogenase-like superfamily [Zopfochytrium polystomum]|nr:quinon protein alcohol dehydrogenase-like superfamily [Zopfochytrium polystomum]
MGNNTPNTPDRDTRSAAAPTANAPPHLRDHPAADQRDLLSRLAPEIAHRIVNYVADHRSLGRLCCVSKLWSVLASRDAHWQSLFLGQWEMPRMPARRLRAAGNETRGAEAGCGSRNDPAEAATPVMETLGSDPGGSSIDPATAMPPIEDVAWKKLYEYRLALERRWTNGLPVRREFPLDSMIVCLHWKYIVKGDITGSRSLHGYTVVQRSDLRTILSIPTPPHLDDFVPKAKVNPEGTAVLVNACNSGTSLQLWDLATGSCKMVITDPQASFDAYGWVGHFIFSVSKHGAKVWDESIGTLLQTIENFPYGIRWWSANGERLLSLSIDGTIRVWSPETGRCERATMQAGDLTHQVESIHFVADGKHVLVARPAYVFVNRPVKISVWNVETGYEVSSITTELGGSYHTIGMNGRRIFGALWQKVELWDIPSGRKVCCIKEPAGLRIGRLVTSTAIAFFNQRKQVETLLDFGFGIPYSSHF